MRVAAIPVGIGLLLAQFVLGACGVGETEIPPSQSSDAVPVVQSPSQGSPAPTAVDTESLLSGATLARYRALPGAYQDALGLYLFVGVSPDLIPFIVEEKMGQWGDDLVPLSELVGEERAKRFEGIDLAPPVAYGRLLGSYYVHVLNAHMNTAQRILAMQELVDVMAPPPPSLTVGESDEAIDLEGRETLPSTRWPDLEKVLVPAALVRLEGLGPRLREQVEASITDTGTDSIENVVIFLSIYELFLLKTQPGLDIPPIEDVLTSAHLSAFRALTDADRERVDRSFQRTVFLFHYLQPAVLPGSSPTVLVPSDSRLSQTAVAELRLVN